MKDPFIDCLFPVEQLKAGVGRIDLYVFLVLQAVIDVADGGLVRLFPDELIQLVQRQELVLVAVGGHLALGLDAVVMYARTEDLPAIRKPGDALMIGAYDWTVMSWEDRAGISEIALQRTR